MTVLTGWVRRSALAFAAVALAAGSASAGTLSQPNVAIAVTTTQLAQRAALEAAQKMGAFEAEGLKVKVIAFRDWSDPVQAMMSDPATFGFGGGSLIRAVVGQNAPLRQIVMVSDRYPYVFHVRGNSGIRGIDDLRGKRIQTVRPGETLDNLWIQLLADSKLTMDDVVRVQGFDGLGALMSNTVDIANLNDLFWDKARQANLLPLLDYNDWRRQKGLPTTDGNNLGWGTSQALLDKNPDTVDAFLRALVRATYKLRNDREFAVAVLMDEPYMLSREAAGAVHDLHRDRWLARLDPAKGDFKFDIEMTAKAMGVPPDKIDLSRVAAVEPIARVLKEMKVSY
jgi:ABC-type nitrate/sulfonate/bicarbonate transport system substrate-binding protein